MTNEEANKFMELTHNERVSAVEEATKIVQDASLPVIERVRAGLMLSIETYADVKHKWACIHHGLTEGDEGKALQAALRVSALVLLGMQALEEVVREQPTSSNA